MNVRRARLPLALVVTTAAVAALAPLAVADAVYHTEHLSLTPVGNEPLRSGYVQNIKAEGPRLYARELFVLDGAAPSTTYTVTRNFFVFGPGCDPAGFVFRSPVGTITTNAGGNRMDEAVIRPENVPGFLIGTHGVLWTVSDASGALQYQTACTTVTLD